MNNTIPQLLLMDHIGGMNNTIPQLLLMDHIGGMNSTIPQLLLTGPHWRDEQHHSPTVIDGTTLVG